MTDTLPTLDRPLGSLDFRVRRVGVADDTPFAAVGRRARAEGTGSGGIDAIWAGDGRVLRELRLDGATARETMETPLGVERRLVLDGTGIVERVVVHHDAPVAWIEWVREPDGEDDGGGGTVLELTWRTGLDAPGTLPDAGTDDLSGGGAGGSPPDPPAWERLDRGIVVRRGDPAVRACFLFGTPPTELTVEPGDDGELLARVRAAIPDSGLRMAIIGAGPHDDADRLLRIAGRTRVAVRGREGGANRLLDEGLRVITPDPALDRTVEAARLRLDAAGLPPTPGVWRTEDATRAALAHLVAGDFGTVLGFLHRLARAADGGRVPDRVAGDVAISYDRDQAGLRFLLLTARYLAWSGDLSGVRGLWPDVEAVLVDRLGTPDAPGTELRTTALAALAVAAEEIGEGDTAAELRQAAGEDHGLSSDRPGRVRRDPSPSSDTADAAGVLLTHVFRLLAPYPDAPRGRLELRPRPPGDWDRFEVRGLSVGSAAVDVACRRDGGRYRFELEQTRGPAPLQVVLAPELPDGEVAATRIDRKPAGLDVERADGRLRVPVQVVLDHLRTLEVEFADDPS